jgi:hypothetical protein
MGGEERRGEYRFFVVLSEGKRRLESSRHRWENNIILVLQDVGWEGMDWIDLAGTCNCGNEPSASIKYGEFLD